MGNGIIQPSFTSGELSPSLYGRVDFQRYYTGLRTCRNFIVRQFGGASNRPGFHFIAETDDMTRRSRLVPFEFSTSQTYVLEFGHFYMRVIKDGGLVVYDSGPNVGQPVEITTPYSSSDLRTLTDIDLIKYVQSADVMTICHTLYAPRQLSRTSHTNWTLETFANVDGPFQDINVNENLTLTSNFATGNVTITASGAMFIPAMVGQMLYIEQSPDYVTKSWEVQKNIVINDIRRAGSNYYQAVTPGTTGTVRPSITNGTECDGDPGVTWKYLHSGFGIVRITGFTSATVVTGTVLKRLPDSIISASPPKQITNVVSGTDPVVEPPNPGVLAQITCTLHGFTTGDSVTIAGVTGATQVNGVHQIIVGDVNTFSPTDVYSTSAYTGGGTATKVMTGVATPTYKWALEAWGGNQGFPGATTYYQQRQVFGGSPGNPQGVQMSRTAGYTDFGTSIPILDDDAISFILNSRRANEVRHFVELAELILLTSDGPFMVRGGSDGVVAPGKITTKRQNASAASHVPPVIVNNQALYVQEKGSQVRGLGYSFESDAFIGNDLTVISGHLFQNRQIVDWAYQAVQFSCIWAVRDDGVLLGFTYLPEHEVAGWHRHDTDGEFESVCCISEGDADVVYAVVKRTINGVQKRYIERMDPRNFSDLRDAFFVDSGLTYDGRNTTATTITVSGGSEWDYEEVLTLTSSTDLFALTDVNDQITFRLDNIAYRFTILGYTDVRHVFARCNRTVPAELRNAARADWEFAHNVMIGLGHLEGKTVDILADGLEHPQRTVANGQVTLERPAAVVHVGLPITSDLETLEISIQGQNIRDKNKLINHVGLIVEESAGVWVGPDANHLTEVKQERGDYDSPAETFGGLVDLRVQANWNKGGRMLIRQAKPLPVTILAIIPEVTLGGS